MIDIKEIKNLYDENGYYVFKNFLSSKFCDEIKKYLFENIPPKINIPFSNIPWGYGNLLDKGPFKNITNDKDLIQLTSSLLGGAIIFNHLVVNNKAAWIGPDVEFHQEALNMQTYAPGNDPNKDWKKFTQIFITLDDQNSNNGCLKIFPRSHKLGLLNYEDMIGPNFGHKRRIIADELNKAYNVCGIKDVVLSKGDALIFNHLIIHGSPTNTSPEERAAIVLQARRKDIKKSQIDFENESKFRSNFLKQYLIKKLNSIESEEKYKDFN